MRVNTDGVLLGAWMSLPLLSDFRPEKEVGLSGKQPVSQEGGRGKFPAELPISLLDIGTGTGVIALMAAQRLAAHYATGEGTAIAPELLARIDGVELDEPSWRDAVKNFAASPWGNPQGVICLNAIHAPMQELPERCPNKKYDLIFSNPPYFIDSLKSSGQARSNARHTDTLSQSELIRCVLQLLKPGGKFALILPAEEGELLLEKIEFLVKSARSRERENVLHPVRICKVRTTAEKPPKRYLMEFVLKAGSYSEFCLREELPLMENGGYTSVYRELTASFYLNF